jgi:hypothetical protein
MAVNGLSTFLHAPLLNESSLSYGTSSKTGGAIEAKATINYNDVSIYEDNRLKHKDVSFKDGTITLTCGYANKSILSPLIGRETKTEQFTPDGGNATTVVRHVSNSNDRPIPVGFGYIVKDFDIDGKKDIYTVKFFYKVEFKPYTQDAKTKQGTKEYGNVTLEGAIYELEDGRWAEEEDFDDETTAIAYLYKLFGNTVGKDVTLASLTIGTLSMTPKFNPETIVYLADTTNATNTITAIANAGGSATVEIKNGETLVTNGSSATWVTGTNRVTITVTNGTESKIYTVIVTKAA